MFANRFTAVVDACVLFSPLKRNLILSLAEAELFRVRWSERILDETEIATVRYLTDKGCIDPEERARRARTMMTTAFDDANVVDYDGISHDIGKLPDERDRHVIAAAIKCRADIIVTDNLKDFPGTVLGRYNIEVKSADEFIADTIDLNSSLSVSAIRTMRQRLNRPEKTPEALLLDLEALGLTLTVDQLRESITLV
ncbi:PIN domain-containing protein [Woeseia oceani]|uniref:PIN domain-containing protein n=1 Tax=Woeseia oceani TaxID=1548547 RepID=A0A193LJS2_9GAMM|nr:PIN domain-containing protein [Woeseia oceani]ANO52649.1 PIN domain-containing protein [Woeseia oceani]